MIIFICGAFLALWSVRWLIFDFRYYFENKKLLGLGFLPFGCALGILALSAALYAMVSANWWPLIISFLINISKRILTMMLFTWFMTDKDTRSTAKHVVEETRRISDVLSRNLQDYVLQGDFSSYTEEKSKAMQDLYNLCMHDPMLKACMDEFGADENTIRDIYLGLCANGIDGWRQTGFRKQYIPVSAITRPRVLRFLLRDTPEISPREKCRIVNEFFKGNQRPLDTCDPVPPMPE